MKSRKNGFVHKHILGSQLKKMVWSISFAFQLQTRSWMGSSGLLPAQVCELESQVKKKHSCSSSIPRVGLSGGSNCHPCDCPGWCGRCGPRRTPPSLEASLLDTWGFLEEGGLLREDSRMSLLLPWTNSTSPPSQSSIRVLSYWDSGKPDLSEMPGWQLSRQSTSAPVL